jgi:hypothetical protein
MTDQHDTTDGPNRVLDLFCGLGGFSAAFEDSERWQVTTVDIEPDFDPDIVADVMDLRPSDFDRDFDVILASPPCTTMSRAAPADNWDGESPATDRAKAHVTLAYHTKGVIKGLSPRYWFIENPVGRMRWFLGTPTGTVTYCQYGRDGQKPTDLWGNHPVMSYRACRAGEDCHERNPHEGGDRPRPRNPAERAKVPYELSDAIREACERGLDGDAPEQQTLSEVTTT